MRFIKFNDMPRNASKYALNSQLTNATTDFSKVCSRDANISGAYNGQNPSVYLGYDITQFNIQD